ncbi:Bifunctional enzyme IspD/IspF [Frankliniella fusca]|uniref:Bifunctional enzyme IspD/IspF n=1 Tax=Frankliniella fusca TaxID=407009 RepID=A0AAE1HX34_9NEOP|nr:Bifunctional enzyme IspD/IspF [Frankliniella fusca]
MYLYSRMALDELRADFPEATCPRYFPPGSSTSEMCSSAEFVGWVRRGAWNSGSSASNCCSSSSTSFSGNHVSNFFIQMSYIHQPGSSLVSDEGPFPASNSVLRKAPASFIGITPT